MATYEASGALKSSTIASHVVAAPAGIVDGEVLVCTMFHAGTPAFTPPAGWTEVTGSPVVLTGVGRVRLWHKVAASEAGSYTWTTDAAVFLEAQIHRVSGADTATPVDVLGAGNTGSGTTATALEVSPATVGVLFGVVCTSGSRDFASGVMTETADGSQSGHYAQNLAATGPTGNRTFAVSSSATWGAVLLAIRDFEAAPAPWDPPAPQLGVGAGMGFGQGRRWW